VEKHSTGLGPCPCCHRPLAEPLSLLVPTGEVAARLDLNVQTARRLIRLGLVPAIVVGERIVRVPRDAFERFMAREDFFPARPAPPSPNPVVVEFFHSRGVTSGVWETEEAGG
jgi:excisionase family DNA binding protein